MLNVMNLISAPPDNALPGSSRSDSPSGAGEARPFSDFLEESCADTGRQPPRKTPDQANGDLPPNGPDGLPAEVPEGKDPAEINGELGWNGLALDPESGISAFTLLTDEPVEDCVIAAADATLPATPAETVSTSMPGAGTALGVLATTAPRPASQSPDSLTLPVSPAVASALPSVPLVSGASPGAFAVSIDSAPPALPAMAPAATETDAGTGAAAIFPETAAAAPAEPLAGTVSSAARTPDFAPASQTESEAAENVPVPAPPPPQNANAESPLPEAAQSSVRDETGFIPVASAESSDGFRNSSDSRSFRSPASPLAEAAAGAALSGGSASSAAPATPATGTGATGAALPSTMTLATLAAQMDRVVLQSVRADPHSIRIELEPAALGRVMVHCRETSEGLSVDIQVQNHELRALLTSLEQNLRQSLESHGFLMGRFSVSCRDGEGRPDGEPAGQRRDHDEPEDPEHRRAASAAAPEERQAAPAPMRNRWVA